MCHFGVSYKKKVKKISEGIPARDIILSKKDTTQCPFAILYSWLDFNRINKKPGIFYRCKITTLRLVHTCQMNPQEHRIAIQRSGSLEVDVGGMKDILSMMQEKPRVSADVIRPMILRYISVHQGISAQFIANFRRRVLLFLVRNPDFSNLTYEQALLLTSGRQIAAEEMTDLDDPFIKQNISLMLRRIMAEDSGTWEAITFMDDLKVAAPGFDYRIMKDEEGRPIGLMYMTAQMRYHARRYGTVICLDAQKRQYNSSGWPYIAPVVKDNEMKVAVAAESIVTEETHGFYIWILQSMAAIEPRFKLSDIRIVFADQKITPTVLQDLGIEDTCILRGDFYHLLNEVWPSHFHSSVYPTIKKFLGTMLLSKTLEEWENAYSCASEVLISRPRMKSALDAIYHATEQYAGFYLRSIEGNLMMNGDVSAEQNHSGVVSYLGEGASFAVAEQVTHLLKRQQNNDKLRRQTEDRQYVQASRFNSSYREPKYATDDVTAKKAFSGYGFKELWTRSIKRSFFLQSEVTADGHLCVWPTKETRDDRTEESTFVLQEGIRCHCIRRIAYSIQCEHEYVMDGGLDVLKYDSRWYHRQVFDKQFPDMAAIFPGNRSQHWCQDVNPVSTNEDIENVGPLVNNDAQFLGTRNEDLDDGDTNQFDDGGDESEEEDDDIPLSQLAAAPSSDKLTFHHIQERATELARSVQNDQVAMTTLFCTLNDMIDRIRLGKSISISFHDGILDSLDTNQNINVNKPRSAVSRACSNSTSVKRKVSHNEYHSRNKKTHRKGVRQSQIDGSTDSVFLPPATIRTRACTMCQNKGHGRLKCPLVTKYGAVPLQLNNEEIRARLGRNLALISKFQTEHRPLNDERVIFGELPASKEVKGLVIHKRYLIDSTLFNAESAENLAVECTILHDFGQEHPSYTKQLFKVHCIDTWIRRSKSNIILCQLEEATIDNNQMMSQTVAHHPPQQFFQQQPSQGFSQAMSQGYSQGFSQQSYLQPVDNNPFATMGFGPGAI
jgi:hypothetical protein